MKKTLIIAVLALLVMAAIITMGAVVTQRSLAESDRTIERIDRIWEKYGK